MDGTRERIVHALGHSWVRGVQVEDDQHRTRRVACDLVAVCATPAPASALPIQHGLAVDFSQRGGFGALPAASAPVYVAGDVMGFMGVARAREHGEAVGRAIAAAR